MVLSALPSSYMSPIAAIEYGIIPFPYQALKTESGFIIKHKIFDTLIPESFYTKKELNEALARLLVGDVLDGDGDFTYKGQPMRLTEKFDTKLENLPTRPYITDTISEGVDIYQIKPILYNIEYTEGFAPISSSLFSSIKSIESSWVNYSNNAMSLSVQKTGKVWKLVQNLNLDSLNKNESKFIDEDSWNEEDNERMLELRKFYPELVQFKSDTMLFYLFDELQATSNGDNGWSAYRENDFVFFLLGKLIKFNSLYPIGEVLTGRIIASYLLSNYSKDEALKLTTEWFHFNKELKALTEHVANIMQFLESDKNVDRYEGEKISNIMDSFVRIGRKYAGCI